MTTPSSDFTPTPSGVVLDEDHGHETVESCHAQLGDVSQQLDGINADLRAGEDHLVAMTNMVACLSNPEDCISQPALEALEAAVGQLVRSMGGDRASISLEAHPTTPHRVVALEGLVDTVKRVWERLIAALKKAWEWFKNFLAALFDSSKQIQRRCEKLEKALDGLADAKPAATVHNERLAKFFGGLGPGKHLSGSEIVSTYNEQNRTMEAIQKGASEFMVEASKGMGAMLAEYRQLANQPEEQAIKLRDYVRHHVAPLYQSASFYTHIGATKVTTPAPETKPDTMLFVREFAFGGGRFYGRVLAKGEDKASTAMREAVAIRHTGFGVSRTGKAQQAASMDALDHEQIRTVLKLVNQRMDFLRTMREQAKTIDATLNALIRDKDAFSIKSGFEYLRLQGINILSSCAGTLMRMSTESSRSIAHYDLDCAKRMLDYVGLSMKSMLTPLQHGLLEVAKTVHDKQTTKA